MKSVSGRIRKSLRTLGLMALILCMATACGRSQRKGPRSGYDEQTDLVTDMHMTEVGTNQGTETEEDPDESLVESESSGQEETSLLHQEEDSDGLIQTDLR